MADMQVSMRLTLENLASGPLGAFADQLKALESVIVSLNAKLASLGKAAKGIGDGAAAGATGTGKLEAALGALSDKLAALETRLGASVDGFAQFGLTAREAAAGVTEAGAAIGMATEKLDGAAASAAAAKTEIGGMAAALKGMAEIWAGLKIEHGLKESVKAASDFATQVAQLRSLGLSGDQIKYAQLQAWKATSQTPYISAADALAARRAMIAATGQNNEAMMDAALPQLLRNAYAYKNLLGSKASIADIIGNFAGLAEARGMSQSAQGMSAASDQALQVALATQGRMKLAQQEAVARQYKYGGAQLVDAPGYARIMALAEQYTLAGHEGGTGGGRGVSQVGTALGMVLKTMLGGKMNKVTEEMLKEMGMFEPGAKLGGTTTTSTNIFGVLRGSTLGERDPLKWVHDVLVPRMLAYAIKNASTYFPHGGEHDPEAQKLALDRVAVQMFGPTGGVNVSNMVAMAANPAVYSRLENTVGLASQAKTGSAAVAETNQYTKAVAEFNAAMTNLKIALGEGLLPVLTPVIDGFAALARGIGDVLHQAPGLATALSTLGAAIGAILTVKGITSLMGGLKSVMGLFIKFGPASQAAAAETGAAATSMAAVWGSRLAAMGAAALRFAGIVGVAFTLYEASAAIKMGGITLQARFNAVLDALAAQLNRWLAWVASAFSKLGDLFAKPSEWMAAAAGAIGAKDMQAKLQASAATIRYAASRPQAFFQSNAAYWDARGVQNLTLPAPIRPPMTAPNTEGAIQAAQDAAATLLTPEMGGLPAMGAKRTARAKPHPQELAQQWGMQDLHRASNEAGAILKASAEQLKQAISLITGATAKDNPGEKYRQAAGILAAGGRMDLAQQALDLADKAVKQSKLQEAKDRLAKLQAELDNQTKLYAAQVTAGVLTPDQAQSATLQEQRQAAPGLIEAANAVRQYEQELGKSTTQIDATRMKLEALGNGLTQFQQKISNTFEGAFQGLFENLMKHKLTLQQMLFDFFNSLYNGMVQNLSQQLAQGLVGSLFSMGSPGGTMLRSMGSPSAAGGALGGLLSTGIGSLFAGTGMSAATTYGNMSAFSQQAQMLAAQDASVSGGGFFSWLGSLLGSILPSFAVGADNIPNDMVAQIHKGEMIVPKAGAEAIRSGKLGASASYHGDVNVVVQSNGMTDVSGSGAKQMGQFGRVIGEHVRQIMLQEMRPGGILATGGANQGYA